jgi:hypothetical protein
MYFSVSYIKDSSSNIGTVRAPLFWGGGRAEEGRRRGGRGAEADRSGFLGRRKGSASLKIQGGASSLAYVIIICNDVTRASLNKVGQNLLTTHFLASLHVCDSIEGLILAYYALLLGTETS